MATTLISIVLIFVVTYPIMGKSFYQKKNVSGILLCFALGTIAHFLGKAVPLIGGAVFGITIGIAVSSIGGALKKGALDNVSPGIKITGKKLLQGSIVLLGFGMSLDSVLKVGAQSLSVMVATVVVCFVTVFFVSKWLKIPEKISILVGVGTCICGGSAIAATSPVIEADDDEIATSISTIFLYNILAVVIFPAIGHLLGMTDFDFGIWAGAAINDTSSVVAAAYSFSNEAGDLATIVKLTRTLLIIPIVAVLSVYMAKKNKTSNPNFSIMSVFPWFVLGFILTCIVNTLGWLPIEITEFMADSAKFFIIIAMTAIGLGTDLVKLIKNSPKPLALGAIAWFMISITSLLVQGVIGF